MKKTNINDDYSRYDGELFIDFQEDKVFSYPDKTTEIIMMTERIDCLDTLEEVEEFLKKNNQPYITYYENDMIDTRLSIESMYRIFPDFAEGDLYKYYDGKDEEYFFRAISPLDYNFFQNIFYECIDDCWERKPEIWDKRKFSFKSLR